MKKKPNKFIAPIVIAGITIGFLASAFKFVFAKSDDEKKVDVKTEELNAQNSQQDS